MATAFHKKWRTVWRNPKIKPDVQHYFLRNTPDVVRVPIDLARLHQRLSVPHNIIRHLIPPLPIDDDYDDDPDYFSQWTQQRENEARRLVNNVIVTLWLVCKSSHHDRDSRWQEEQWLHQLLEMHSTLALPPSLLLPLLNVGPVVDACTKQVKVHQAGPLLLRLVLGCIPGACAASARACCMMFVPQPVGDLSLLLGLDSNVNTGLNPPHLSDVLLTSSDPAVRRDDKHQLFNFTVGYTIKSDLTSRPFSPWWMLSSPHFGRSLMQSPLSPGSFNAMDVQLFESFKQGCFSADGLGFDNSLIDVGDVGTRAWLRSPFSGTGATGPEQQLHRVFLPRMADVVQLPGVWHPVQQQVEPSLQLSGKQKQAAKAAKQGHQDSPSSSGSSSSSRSRGGAALGPDQLSTDQLKELQLRGQVYFGMRRGFYESMGGDLIPLQHAAQACRKLLQQESGSWLVAEYPLPRSEEVCRVPLHVANVTRLAAMAWHKSVGDSHHACLRGDSGSSSSTEQAWLDGLFQECKTSCGSEADLSSDPMLLTCAAVFGFCLQQRVAAVQSLYADPNAPMCSDALAASLVSKPPADVLWLPSVLAELVNNVCSFRLHVSNGRWMQVVPVLPESYTRLPAPSAAARMSLSRVAADVGLSMQQVHVDLEHCRSPGPEENPDRASKWWTLRAGQQGWISNDPPGQEALWMSNVVSVVPCPVPDRDCDLAATLLHERWWRAFVPSGGRELCSYQVLEQALGQHAIPLKYTEYC